MLILVIHTKGERECIIPFPKSENERGMKKTTFPKFGHRSGTKKSTPEIQEREGNEKNPSPKFGNGKGMKKIHSHNSGMGIRGYHSQEYPGTGTGTGMEKNKMI